MLGRGLNIQRQRVVAVQVVPCCGYPTVWATGHLPLLSRHALYDIHEVYLQIGVGWGRVVELAPTLVKLATSAEEPHLDALQDLS